MVVQIVVYNEKSARQRLNKCRTGTNIKMYINDNVKETKKQHQDDSVFVVEKPREIDLKVMTIDL